MRWDSSLSGSPVAAVRLAASASRPAATWAQAFLNVWSQAADRMGPPSEARQNSSPDRPIWVWSHGRWTGAGATHQPAPGR